MKISKLLTLLTFQNTEQTNTKNKYFPECKYKNNKKVSIKSLAYTVRSESTNNYIYIQHYIKLLIKMWP